MTIRIYVDYAKGDDSSNGLTEETPVKSIVVASERAQLLHAGESNRARNTVDEIYSKLLCLTRLDFLIYLFSKKRFKTDIIDSIKRPEGTEILVREPRDYMK